MGGILLEHGMGNCRGRTEYGLGNNRWRMGDEHCRSACDGLNRDRSPKSPKSPNGRHQRHHGRRRPRPTPIRLLSRSVASPLRAHSPDAPVRLSPLRRPLVGANQEYDPLPTAFGNHQELGPCDANKARALRAAPAARAWKKAQLSHQFHRVSESAGKNLDGIAQDLSNQIAVVDTRLKQAEAELLRYPDLCSLPNSYLADVDKEMMCYTDQLTEWLKSFTALAVPSAPNPPPAPSDAMDVDSGSEPATPFSLVAKVKESIVELEDKMDEVYSAIHDPELLNVAYRERNAAFVDKIFADRARASSTRDGAESKGEETVEEDPESLADLKSTADELEGKLRSQAQDVAVLAVKNAHAKQKIEQLEAQRDQRRRLKEMMQTQLKQFETWSQERRTQLRIMTEQLARLNTEQPQTAPVLDEAVLQLVRARVEAIIQTDVVPALAALRVQYAKTNDRRVRSYTESMQPAVDQTNEMCRLAELVNA
ncbi:hypothetical protein B0H17DRAFT_381320 [Mycena rosella]|uniref:Uncharacterized protein n=1 Tax=Mycena rosella TaxID=1033263 RepID=A0AAD7G154_MYCRO|nr:hypothetical protein B0H17DRAFT_381320 [Mycena rosella]